MLSTLFYAFEIFFEVVEGFRSYLMFSNLIFDVFYVFAANFSDLFDVLGNVKNDGSNAGAFGRCHADVEPSILLAAADEKVRICFVRIEIVVDLRNDDLLVGHEVHLLLVVDLHLDFIPEEENKKYNFKMNFCETASSNTGKILLIQKFLMEFSLK